MACEVPAPAVPVEESLKGGGMEPETESTPIRRVQGREPNITRMIVAVKARESVRKVRSEAQERAGTKALVRTSDETQIKRVQVGSLPMPRDPGAIVREIYAKGYEREDETDNAAIAKARKWTSRRGFYSVPVHPTEEQVKPEQVWHKGPMPRSLLSKLAAVRKAIRTFRNPPK
jgi:hypothetical protein